MPTKTINVPKISCAHCTATIERELGEVEGVREVKADAGIKEVRVRWETPATWEKIESVLNEIGFPADA